MKVKELAARDEARETNKGIHLLPATGYLFPVTGLWFIVHNFWFGLGGEPIS